MDGKCDYHSMLCNKQPLTPKAFDLAIVDPPYGINFAMEKERKATATRSAQFKFARKEWDSGHPRESISTS